MIDQPQFRTVLRGLDPDQVAAAIKDLHTSLVVARRTAADRTVELTKVQQEHQELQAALDEARDRLAELERVHQASARGFGDLGARIASMLSLAEEEADLMRAEAVEEVQRQRDEAAAYATSVREESDSYATQSRLKAERDARRTTDAAQASADSVVAKAQEDAARMRAEAEAFAHDQRQRVEQAEAGLQAELAARRGEAVAEILADKERQEADLEAAMARLAQLDEEITARFREADALAARTVEEAEAKAAQMVRDAAEDAERTRLQAEHELAAAITQQNEVYGHLRELRRVLDAVVDAHEAGVDAPVGRHARQPAEADEPSATTTEPVPDSQHAEQADRRLVAEQLPAPRSGDGPLDDAGTHGGPNGSANVVAASVAMGAHGQDDWSGGFDGEPWRHAEAQASNR